MSAHFDITNLSVSYGNQHVLRDLNWHTQAGQHIVLAGKSGSGKTTLAKAIAGLIPYQGSIRTHSSDRTADSDTTTVHYVPNWY